MTIITPTGITGITSITSTGNTLQFQNPSGADVSVSGLNVTSGTNINVTGIVTASGGFSGNINSTGVSTFSGGIVVAAGSASAPSISPTGDSNTGIFFPDGDTVSIGEGGAEVVRVHSLGRVLVGTANTNIAGAPSNKGAKQFIYTTEGNGEWALQARHDSTTGNGLFVRAGNNSTTYTARFTGYDENNVHLNIDGLGRVTTPYQPFVAGGAASGSISGNNNHIWATSGYVWSNIGNHWNESTGTFTAPVDGVYHVTAAIRYSGVPVTPSFVYIYFLASYQSASGQPILLWSTQTESGGTYRPRILTALMYCRANDTIQPRLYVSGGTISLDGGPNSQSDCFLNIYLLG